MAPIAEGTRFGRFEITARLGAGGMAEVYRARDLTLGRQVALKVLPRHLLGDAHRAARFRQEAMAASSLNHPNIVTVYEIGTEGDMVYMALELVEGKTLRQMLVGGALPVAAGLKIGAQVAEGLAKAHATGIVHRDLKPENVMVTDDSLVKILDFGVAKIAGSAADELEQFATAPVVQTGQGVVLGTVAYMSPEQARGADVDLRSDQFALGILLYEMATGRHPFRRDTPVRTLSAILDATPESIFSYSSGAPAPLGWIIERCLAKNPEDRYGSTRDLARDLQALAQHLSGASGTLSVQAPARAKGKSRSSIDSIAVLPFVNASGDADADYLGDGITETIINSLSQLPKLRVMARSTVFRYKDRADDAQRVGAELQVRAVVTGRVQIRGGNLVVSAELVNVAEGSQLWGAQYNRKFEDIFSIQEDIATEITAKLRVRLTGAQRKRLSTPQTRSSEAYELYLRGRFFWNKRTPEGIKQGVEHFERAIALDPDFALAHAGLADCYCVMGAGEFGIFPPRQVMPKAQAAAARAVALDDSLAETHSALATVKFWYDWDWPAAEREFQRAILINPGYAAAHAWYAEFLSAMGRFEEALDEGRRAASLDPMSVTAMWTLARVLNLAGDHVAAIAEMLKALEIEPTFVRPYYILAWAHYRRGEIDKAFDALRKSVSLGGDSPFKKGFTGHLHGALGQVEEARKILDEMAEQAKIRYVSPFYVSIVYAGLGDKDRAFEYLEKALTERSSYMAYLKVTPFVDALRSDPRFADLMRRMGYGPP